MSDIQILSADEQIELHQLEQRITQAFYEAGLALEIIRDRRLYRSNYNTFEAYCSDRWSYNRSYANKLIRAAKVIENLDTNCTQTLPTNEYQCRALASLPPDRQVEVWTEALESTPNGKPSAAQITAIASRISVKEPPNSFPLSANLGEDPKVASESRMETPSSYSFEKVETPAMPTDRFQCIVADPPWKYDLRVEDETHRNRIPYPPMELQEIIDLPIADLCDRSGAVMWLWTTNNHIFDAGKCLEAWGFTLKTVLTWEKVSKAGNTAIGTGHWLRNSTEHCLLAIRGDVRSFRHIGTLSNQSNMLHAPRREHSRKPEEFYELVETLCPELSKLEMFARQVRPDWEAWGNQTELFG